MKKELTEDETDKITAFIRKANVMWALKVGDKIEQKHIDIINSIFGPKQKEECLLDIRFTENGKPLIVKGAENIKRDEFFAQFKEPKDDT